MKHYRILLTLLFNFLSLNIVLACSCAQHNPDYSIIWGMVAFVGIPIDQKLEPPANDLNANRLYTFAVIEKLKGEVPDTVVVATGRFSSMCGSNFTLNEKYLVYCNSGNLLSTNSCMGNKKYLPQGKREIDYLRNKYGRDLNNVKPPKISVVRQDSVIVHKMDSLLADLNIQAKILISVPQKDKVKIAIYNSNNKLLTQVFTEILNDGIYEILFDECSFNSRIVTLQYEIGSKISKKYIRLLK